MPSSDTAQISTIIDLVQIINPGSSLDVGCGYGKYGYLIKESLMEHVWDKDKNIVNAVEGYEAYIADTQKAIYNNIFICNAMSFEKYLLINYDLVTIIDAFEHLTVENGKLFIKEILKKSNYLLISVPRYVTAQSGLTDDPDKLEEHRAFWTRGMCKKMGNCLIIPNSARKTIVLYSQNGKFAPAIKKFCSKKLLLKFLPYIFIDVFNYMLWFIKRNNPDHFISRSKF